MTYEELFRQGSRQLSRAGIEEAALDARLLLEYACQISRSDLLAHGDRSPSPAEEAAYLELIARRQMRIPLQLLTGTQEFMGLEFDVNEHVLIPRQDTEILVEEVLKNLHDGMRILDMCTGSGCILVSLMYYTNNCEGLGVDCSAEALEVARGNAKKLLSRTDVLSGQPDFADQPEALTLKPMGENAVGRIQFAESDLFEKIEGRFDVVVSNPPYIPSAELEELMPEVGRYEPRDALDGGVDGLSFYRAIIKHSAEYLVGGGQLFFEIGCEQAEAVRQLMEQAGYLEIKVVKDYAGLDRVVYGTLGFGRKGVK